MISTSTVIPQISVVIPVYNKETYISRAIDSVLSQSAPDFELIIVDDGSTDNSYDIINSYSDERIILIKQANQGESAARNSGIKLAKGAVIAFLDADDEWMPDFLETISSLHKKHPEAGLYGTAFRVETSNGEIRNIVCDEEAGDRICDSYFSTIVNFRRPIFNSSSFAARKEIFETCGYYSTDFKIGADHDFFGRVALYYPIAYSPHVSSIYYLETINNTDASRISNVVNVPLLGYLKTHSADGMTGNLRGLEEYCDHWRIMTAARNIYSGHRQDGRMQLYPVKSKKNLRRKYVFLLISYLPIKLSWIPLRMVRVVLRRFKSSL